MDHPSKKSLNNQIKDYLAKGLYPFHMPGHKRNDALCHETYGMDLTEVPGTDDLHHPEEMILQAMKRASRIYDVEDTFFLVNGSTAGILTAISATLDSNQENTILVARNCHKSVYHAAMLNRCRVKYLYPVTECSFHINGGILPGDVQKALKDDPDIKAVVITSPTYDGVVSDVELIAKVAHQNHCVLIVDEAHGAHFKPDSMGCKDAVSAGADLVIHSLHKTLPALTQTALLHVQGDLINRDKVKRYLQIYQTSSPSYLLMSSIDQCMEMLDSEGEVLFRRFHELRNLFDEKTKQLKRLRIMGEKLIGTAGIVDVDPGKIVISTSRTDMTGEQLSTRLRHDYQIQMEMASVDYVVGIMTMMDTEEGILRLAHALLEIDLSLSEKECRTPAILVPESKSMMKINEAMDRDTDSVILAESAGNVSAEFVYAYPPGIPVIVPGEMISEDAIQCILQYQEAELSIQGLTDQSLFTIRVVR